MACTVDSLFASCAIHAHEAIKSGLITRDDVESLEPFVYIGMYFVCMHLVFGWGGGRGRMFTGGGVAGFRREGTPANACVLW
jgi:hypothetical protein